MVVLVLQRLPYDAITQITRLIQFNQSRDNVYEQVTILLIHCSCPHSTALCNHQKRNMLLKRLQRGVKQALMTGCMPRSLFFYAAHLCTFSRRLSAMKINVHRSEIKETLRNGQNGRIITGWMQLQS